MSLPKLTRASSVESAAVMAVGISPATLVFQSKTGVAYGYPVSAVKRALGISWAQVSNLYQDVVAGEVSAGQTWNTVRKAVSEQGKHSRKYKPWQTKAIMSNPIIGSAS